MAFDAVKDFFMGKPQDSYDETDSYSEENEFDFEEPEEERISRNRTSLRDFFRGTGRREDNREEDNDYSFNSYEEDRKSSGTTRVILIKAKRFSEVKRIAENLKRKCSVIINFEGMEKEEAQRTIDFLSGCTFAFDGHIQKISHCTFIFAVGSVDLVGRIEEMKDAESYFSF